MPLHHYLPASFISRFSLDHNAKGSRYKKIIVGDKKTQKWFSSPANKVGCVKNLYTIADHSISSEFIDQTWSEYEQKLPTAIDNLIYGNVDAETWMRVLVPFVACMLVRDPNFGKRFNQRFPPEVQQSMGDILTPDNANRARLREIPRLLTCVIAAKWQIFTAHGKEKLITNDLGYAPFISPKYNDRGIAIPLNKKKILAVIPSMEDRTILHNINGKWVPNIEYANLPPGNHQGLNRALARTALRFVFGPDSKTVQKYFLNVPQKPLAPEPIELGFSVELLRPTYEFTWHRLVSAISHSPSDTEGWDFPMNWDVITSGWYPAPILPVNLVEFPPALKKIGDTIQLKFYDSEVFYDISPLPLLEQQGNYKEIIQVVTKALPNHNLPPTLRASILARRGSAFDELGKTHEAIVDFTEACKLDPTNAKAHANYGYMLIKKGDPEEALIKFSKAITADPELGLAYLNRGVALITLGRFSDSMEDLTKATELLTDENERASAFLNRGNLFKIQNLYREAADNYGIAASLFTGNFAKSECFTKQAYAYVSCELTDQALEAFKNAVKFNHFAFRAIIGHMILQFRRKKALVVSLLILIVFLIAIDKLANFLPK